MDDCKITREFVLNIFKRHQLFRTSLNPAPKETIPKGIDNFIAPFKLNKDEKIMKTGLANMISKPTDHNVEIIPFSIDDLEALLILQAPRKVESRMYYPPIEKEIKLKVVKPKKEVITKIKRNHSIIKSTSEGIINEHIDEEEITTLKRGRYQNQVEIEEKVSSVVNPNMYIILQQVFDKFWELEIEEYTVSSAFFAKLSSVNCAQFGLTKFAAVPCSLPIIKDKLEERKYSNYEEFVNDFYTMFDNIFTYYPSDHAAYSKAIELRDMFESSWEIAKNRLV